MPVPGERKLTTMPATTTTDMKWGKNVAVWVSFEMNLLFISVIAIAKKMGMGKQMTICYKAIMKVFLTVLRKSAPPINSLKFCNPTKVEPDSPLKMLYS